MHKPMSVPIIFFRVLILCVMLFALGNIFSGRVGIQKEVDAFTNQLKIDGNKPEQITAQENELRTHLENVMSSNNIQAFSIFILGITALILLWYTDETKRLADETRRLADETKRLTNLTEKQIKIKMRPVIVVEDITSDAVIIKNVGESPALGVEIQSILARRAKGSQNSYDVRFDRCPILEREAKAARKGFFKVREPNGFVNPSSAPFLDYRNEFFVDSYYVIILFNDIERGAWESKTLVDKNGPHFQGIYEKMA